MATISRNERQRNAALLSAFYQAARKRFNQPPAALPDAMRPVNFDRAAAYFDRADLKNDAFARRAYRSAIWALSNADCGPQTGALVKAWRKQGGSGGYGDDYDSARQCLDEMGSRPTPRVKPPDPFINFDAESWITTVSVTSTTPVADRAEAISLVKPAFPANWSKASPSFFKIAELGTLVGMKFKPTNDFCRNWSDPIFLHEQVVMTFNGDNDFETDNHFLINMIAFADEKQGGDADGVILEYDYTLTSSNWSKSFIIWDRGGIDVDQGSYRATYAGNQLTTVAKKSVRFVAPRNSPYEIAVALNMMAPATIWMLLTRLNDFAALHDNPQTDLPQEMSWPTRLPTQAVTTYPRTSQG